MNIWKDVYRFHRRFGHEYARKPARPMDHTREWRKFMIKEEAREVCEAIDSGDPVKIARECIDLVYVAVGTMVSYGIPFRPCWRAVHKANMAKRPNPDGGKPLKGPSWQSPDEDIVMGLRLWKGGQR